MSLRGCECRCSIYSSSFSFKFIKDLTVFYFVKVIVIFLEWVTCFFFALKLDVKLPITFFVCKPVVILS